MRSFDLPEEIVPCSSQGEDALPMLRFEPSRIHQLTHVLVTPEGMLYDRDGLVAPCLPRFMLEHPCYGSRHKLLGKMAHVHHRIWPRPLRTDAHLWLSNFWSAGYFHWMVDVLPKIIWLKPHFHDLFPDGFTLLLPQSYQKLDFVEESLGRFGIERVEYVTRGLCVQELMVTDLVSPSGTFRPLQLRELREQLQQVFTCSESVVGPSLKSLERIYISRGKASRRKIHGEADLIQLLKKWNFTVLELESLSLLERAHLLRETKYLLSNHGAGLTNMLFCSREVSLLELRSQRSTEPWCFRDMAHVLELKYDHLLCAAHHKWQGAHRGDLVVDLISLEQYLRSWLS